jgi:protein O-mannosyl-transferase
MDDAPHQRTAVSSLATKSRLASRPWLLAVILAVVTVLSYQPAWHAGFIWDDNDHLTANPAMTAPHGLRMIWSSLTVSRYYPLTLTTLWFEHRLWGFSSMPYHLVNIAFHVVNGILVFLILRRLRIPAPWLAAMVWVLHPVNVESAAWITEMKNTQSGLFFFLSVLCFLQFDIQKNYRCYAAALVCGVAAMLSKPSTVVLPVALALCVWWERGGWRRSDIARIIPFFGLALGMSVWTVIEQRYQIGKGGPPDWKLETAQRFVVAGKAVWFYAAKLIWPAQLTFVYPRWDLGTKSPLSWIPLVGVIVVGIVMWVWRREAWARAAIFGCGFFVAALLPVLGFFDIFYFRYSFVADHFQYLASVGLIALVVGASATVCRRTRQGDRGLGTLVAIIVLLILGVLTWRQAGIYQDLETLWNDTLTKNPECWMAHNNLGDLLLKEGKVSDAAWQYEQGLRFKADDAIAHYNLGLTLARLGRQPEAAEQWEQALRIRPNYADAHNNLGNVFLREGNVSDAIGHYEQALRTKPDYAEAHYNLGLALARLGREQEATVQWEQALQIKPDYADAHNSLGNVFLREGKVSDAIGHYEQALRINPDYIEAHYDLGIALEKAGRVPEAIQHYEQALRLRPNLMAARNALTRLQAAQ